MPELIEQIRQQTASIADRLKNDARFKAQVLSDPEATLIATGLLTPASPTLLNKQDYIKDIAGRQCDQWGFTCQDLTSCWTTGR